MGQMKIRGNTQIIAGTITNTEIAAAAGIASTKLADGANFIKKDGSVAMTAALTLAADPTSALHAATKQYVDNLSTGVLWKQSVRVASTANVTLAATQTIDGVALAAGDRVLCKNQTLPAENGIYVVAAGSWSRSADADVSVEVKAGMSVWVNEGTVNGDSQWLLTTNDAIVLGTTALTFTQVSGLGQISAGAGLTKAGNALDVVAADNSIQVNADSVQVKIGSDGVYNNLSVLASGIVVDKVSTFQELWLDDGGGGVVIKGDSGSSRVWIPYLQIDTNLSILKNAFSSSLSLETITSARSWVLANRNGTFTFREDFVGEEAPSGLINGSNTAYTLANTPITGTLALYLNGVRLRSGAGNDYTISTNAITMLYAPQTGDVLIAEYIK